MPNLHTRHITLTLLALLTACHSAKDKAAQREAKKAEQEKILETRQAEILATLPADSPLAKLKLGMTEAEVAAQLGAPTAQNGHVTGRAFNPFSGGRDTYRMVYYYQGIGRVEFSQGSWGRRNGVIDIQADANESGGKQDKK